MKLTIEDFKGMMAAVSAVMQENKEYLVELDSAMGDGDLGLTMSKGFKAAEQMMAEYKESDIGKALFQAGVAMNNAASSTMGTLIATAIMRAGKDVKGLEEVGPEEITKMAQAAVDGVKERGKAKTGEKTILDAMVPAAEALKESVGRGDSLPDAFSAAAKAAEEGVEATKDMVAQHGRAHYYGEKSKGKQDPGATVALLAARALEDYLKNR